MSGAYFEIPRTEFVGFSEEEQLARMFHEAYERRAAWQFGYLPRSWERLTAADQDLRIKVAREMIDRQLVKVLPDCPHTRTTLKRIEVRQCDICKAFPRMDGAYEE
jgi:hypothetical protein